MKAIPRDASNMPDEREKHGCAVVTFGECRTPFKEEMKWY
jgi:hypothetical protein